MVPHVHTQNASKMNGVFVKMEEKEFLKLINENEDLLIVHSEVGIFTNQYLYLTSYKGFHKEPLPLPGKHEKIFQITSRCPSHKNAPPKSGEAFLTIRLK